MAAKILSEFKQRLDGLELQPSQGGCFEITANGNLIYSKLSTGQFPREDEIVAQLTSLF